MRLAAPLSPHYNRGDPVSIVVDGRPLGAFSNEPVAVALWALGRRTLSRSLRFHRPRGIFCSTGDCGRCAMEVDGVGAVPTCRARATEHLVVRGEHGWPSAQRDLLRVADVVGRRLPYSFYHHRFLRPRFLRQRYLATLRGLGGHARPPGASKAASPKSRRSLSADVAVIGGGPAGLAAAAAAAEAGKRVVLLEAEAVTGGHWLYRSGAGGADAVGTLQARVADANVDVLVSTTVLGIFGEGDVAAVSADAVIDVQAAAIIVATGAYDYAYPCPGNDRPGVISARMAERLVYEFGVRPGGRALVWGGGTRVGETVEALTAAGTEVVGVVPFGGETGIEVDGVRVFDDHSVAGIHGASGLTGVALASARKSFRVRCDTVVTTHLQPTYALPLQAGARSAFDGATGTLIDIGESGATSLPWLFVAGSATGATRPEDVLASGTAAGQVAAGSSAPPPLTGAPGRSLAGAGGAPAASHVCFCEDVRAWEIAREIRLGYRTLEEVKRRAGVVTGPCQGAFCLATTCAIAEAETGSDVAGLPTARPPARRIRLGELVADERRHG